MAARVVLHLLYFRIGGIRSVIFPSRAILAGIMCKSVYLLFYIIADINPCVLVFVIVIVVEKVLGDHVLLQPLLRDLAFKQQAPHRGPGGVGCQVRSSAVVRLVPTLVVLAGI